MDNSNAWSRSLVVAALSVLPLGSATIGAAASGDPKYRITEVGQPSNMAQALDAPPLNASGQVTGYAYFYRSMHAFLWQPNGNLMVDLGPFDWAGVPTGESIGLGLNASGQVTGYSGPTTGPLHAFLWKSDGTPMTDLGTLGGQYSEGLAINDSGQVVGDAGTATSTHAFIWKNDGHPMRDLGTLGGTSSVGRAVNASGQVAGQAATSGNAAKHAFFWKNDGTAMLDLGTLGGTNSDGQFVNASGQVIGASDMRGQTATHGFLWRNDGTPMVDLGTLGGPNSAVAAINDSGQIAGSAFVRSQGVSRHAVLWTNGGTQIHDLGTLGGPTSLGNAINSSGWVVGWSRTSTNHSTDLGHAFLWMNNGQPMKDLNNLVDPADPLKACVVLIRAKAINDSADIVAQGNDICSGGNLNEYLVRTSSLALSPRTLAFGNQKAGTAGASKSVTVQNNTASAVPITSIALAGIGANQFAATNNCGSSIAGSGSCTIKVSFKPTSKGAKSATLSVNGGGGGLRVVILTGTGT